MIGHRMTNKEMLGLRMLEQDLFSSLNSWSLFSCWFRNLKHWGNCSLWIALYISQALSLFVCRKCWDIFNLKFNICAVLGFFRGVWIYATPWTIAWQTPQSLGFSRQEYWNGLPFPSSGGLPDSELEPVSHVSCIGKQMLYHWCHLGT